MKISQQPILTTAEYHAYDKRIADANILLKHACPCNYCCGGKMIKRQVIYEHMLKFGHNVISPFPQNYYPDSLQLHSMRDVEVPNINEEETNTDGDFKTLDEGIEVDRMLNEGFKDVWKNLMEDASKPMYDTCKFSHLTTILVLLNLQIVHGWTNESVDDLLAFLHELLPPKSTFSNKMERM